MDKRSLEAYKSRLCSAEEAVSLIKSHQRVALGHAAGVPETLMNAMIEAKENYEGVEVVHMLCLGEGRYMEPGLEKHFRHNGLFLGGTSRKAVEEQRGDFTPCFFHEIPRLFTKDVLPIDVAMVQLSPPNEEGYCSFGVSCDYTKPACEAARVIIAEVNDQMPHIEGGENLIHVSKLDRIVESSRPIFELPIGKIGEIEKQIAAHCASLVKDGSTLQLGIGSIPDAVLLALKDKKHLGIHTEMFSDGVVELFEEGVIDGSAKTLHKGKMVATFLMGSHRLYNFVHNNPDVEMYPCSYTNNPMVIAQNKDMVSINSCIEIDLMGQVSSESIGLRQYSGVGGQVDYIRGARMGNGISILAMPATAAKGTLSRIVPYIKKGSVITTSRCDVDYIVTEYGIARLWGKTLRERAKELIKIAHPDFRGALEEEYERRFR